MEKPFSKCPDNMKAEIHPPIRTNMATFTIQLAPIASGHSDVPTLRINFGDEYADSDRITRDIAQQIDELIETGQLSGGELLRIDGRSPLPAAFTFAQKLLPLYEAIAVRDPKMGTKGVECYVVGASRSSRYAIGDPLVYPIHSARSTFRIVLCGPPNTGKSCFREGLKQALLNLPDAPASFVISACPDGDGSWFSETARRDPALARQLKNAYKAKFTPKFAAWKAEEIRRIHHLLLVFDVGGKMTPENRLIMQAATHAVILAQNDEQVAEWRAFCTSFDPPLPVIAIFLSDYQAIEDQILSTSPILQGAVHHLERGEPVAGRPAIRSLAEYLTDLAGGDRGATGDGDRADG
jgi:CRISPR-associated protein Csx3